MHKITHIQLEKIPLGWKILHWRRGQRGRLISAVDDDDQIHLKLPRSAPAGGGWTRTRGQDARQVKEPGATLSLCDLKNNAIQIIYSMSVKEFILLLDPKFVRDIAGSWPGCWDKWPLREGFSFFFRRIRFFLLLENRELGQQGVFNLTLHHPRKIYFYWCHSWGLPSGIPSSTWPS